ncbi:MAG: AmmeMemoRadiSam system protein B, partial [Elusimicrobia bacterium]|nr:AmmeMemoRadiSam system protein B [Elusimicrobiota bacterium]
SVLRTAVVLGALWKGLARSTAAGSARPSTVSRERPPAVAGQFYPEDPDRLRRTVDELVDRAGVHDLMAPVVAVLVPHAGYVFSGAVAAEGFKAVGTDWRTVVLLGPSHHVPVRGAAVFSRGAYVTPLGRVRVDEDLAGRLLKVSPLFQDLPDAHAREHSLEVELPFLQRLLTDFKIVPITLNDDDPDTLRRIGEAVARVVKGRKALIVISSDLSHYPDQETARRADGTLLRAVEGMDPETVQRTSRILLGRREPGLATMACGEAALLAGLHSVRALKADRAAVLKYANSGDVEQAGDPSRVVGYAAVAFVKSGEPRAPVSGHDGDAKTSLLEEARRSLAEAFEGKPYEPRALSQKSEWNMPAAVFVTLTKRGRLRGCIGTTVPQTSLLEGVRYFARAAAFEDSRFQPLEPQELDGVRIEISVLSQPRAVENAEAIEPGRHGVVVRQGRRSGLFLPTVWEQLPGKKEFLSRLCTEKAGLPAECWQDPAVELQVFTSDVFEEP